MGYIKLITLPLPLKDPCRLQKTRALCETLPDHMKEGTTLNENNTMVMETFEGPPNSETNVSTQQIIQNTYHLGK